MYVQVKIGDTDDDDIAIDASGYTGNFQRKHNDKNLIPISPNDLINIIGKDNKMVDIMRCIKEIDKEHNGYVTSTELDDILKLCYKKELSDKNLKIIFKPYASIQNKILIDYKKFRDWLLKSVGEYKKK